MEQEHFESHYPDTTYLSEIQKISDFIKAGKSCQLLGIPGVGRSTLLSLLENNKNVRVKHFGDAEDNIHFVEANFSEIRKRPLFDAMKFLFLSLTESLRERGMMEEYLMVNEVFKETLGFADELVLFQGLKQAIDYLALERKLTIVFLFDRFEEYIPTVTSEFFSNLRILRNRVKYKFLVVFSLYRPLEMVLEPSLLSDFYEFVAGNFIYVKLMDRVAIDYRTSSIEKITRKKLLPVSLEKILLLTGGHAKLTKLAVEVLLAHEGKLPEDFETFLLSHKSMIGALMEIWFSLSPAEQSDLLQGNFEEKDIMAYLEDVNLIKDKKIQIPLLAHFITSELHMPQEDKQPIIYDQNTNTIRVGAVVLSDQLTSSEFRLLRYLLQNQERVIEREEIIGVVWQGVKSTAGITDQAVDQLIFRLRRKIEEDANNPIHLQTVKGRGFKFTGQHPV
jgi:DNA-binding winged helix-turn-helix (wHTH) protein